MKIKMISMDEETGEVELDLDEEGQNYLIQLGFEALLMQTLAEIKDNEENR